MQEDMLIHPVSLKQGWVQVLCCAETRVQPMLLFLLAFYVLYVNSAFSLHSGQFHIHTHTRTQPCSESDLVTQGI